MKTFRVEVVTPDRAALSTEATSLQVPAWEGYLGVLAGHAPLLTVLRAGVVTVKTESAAGYYAIRGGFMEVAEGRATILADDFVAAKDLEQGELERALDEARTAGGEVTGDTPAQRAAAREHVEEQRAQALAWAQARMKALEQSSYGA